MITIRERRDEFTVRRQYDENPIAIALAGIEDEIFVELPHVIEAINGVADAIRELADAVRRQAPSKKAPSKRGPHA